MKWLDEAVLTAPVKYIGCNPVYQIDDSEDVRLAFYRLTRKRDHKVYSWFHKVMLDRDRNFITVISKTVVHRALRGCHELVSVMLIEDLIDELGPLIEQRRLIEGVYIVSRETYQAVVGLIVNGVQACSALIDLQTATEISTELFSQITETPLPPRPAESYFWQNCEWGLDRRSAAKFVTPPMLVLDDVRNSDNVGAIMRTAFSFGIRSMVVTKTTMSAIGCRSARTSMGAMNFFSVYVAVDLVETIGVLKAKGIEVIGTSPRARENITARPTKQWALVLGNEELGSSDAVMHACSTLAAIPQVAGDSFSVSVAGGICVYELMRDHLQAQPPGAIGTGDC
ncbi:RNA methyltransferase [Gregarina niphandrodes]|uniref:RNA methyltransferase n=1 Tax=Gregarina niphandrodes TaxID=110365 RepID=A0A023B1B5_GRENI|nr:RNA methyltransferase [Gregarina niphandrodes]EZG47204.1 RNA methyltransferase [Gregarina niphandrodes]|eukprot:XP_011132199.1 RNA methyltransferase [Gregarina niphandrodes]